MRWLLGGTSGAAGVYDRCAARDRFFHLYTGHDDGFYHTFLYLPVLVERNGFSGSSWLRFPASPMGDKSDIPISDRSALLTADTNRATIVIVSNSYGEDSIIVTAIK